MHKSSVIEFGSLFSKAAKEIIKVSTDLNIHVSKTYQNVPNIMIAGDIGAFVSFKGDYNGIMVMNFSGESALEIVQAYLKMMGMPEGDIPVHYTSDDVRSNIGEVVNQIIGKTRQMIQIKYDLASKANIPAVVPITTPIGLTLETAQTETHDCLRISLSTPSSNRFYIELSLGSSSLVEVADK